MLATAADVLPRGPEWAYEFKWDGVRALVDVGARGVRLYSRRGNEVTKAYPEIVGMFAGTGDALVDGEIVSFVGGVPSFEALQARMHVRGAADARRLAESAPVTFVAFDLLRRDGRDLTAGSYTDRRAELEAWFRDHPDWTLSPSFDDGAATEQAARAHGLEGVVAKRVRSAYRPGLRTRDWVKLRFLRTGDFAVVGWEAPRDEPNVLSSLVLAAATPDGLVFAGKAGSGLTGRLASTLQRRMTEVRTCPVSPVPPPSPARVTHWVVPEVVVEVQFSMTTAEGRLRQPVFRRVRDDKTVDEAIGES
jgi:bifunctional non-homologous end joining protein LigD